MWSWTDVLSQDESIDFQRLLAQWPYTVAGRLRPIGMSAFGDIFVERPSGTIECLDVLEGGLRVVASSSAQFARLMNSPEWREQNLMPEVVALLIERGLRRSPAQCFALAPHPVFTGSIQWDRAVVMDAYPWHSICSQLLDAPSRVAT